MSPTRLVDSDSISMPRAAAWSTVAFLAEPDDLARQLVWFDRGQLGDVVAAPREWIEGNCHFARWQTPDRQHRRWPLGVRRGQRRPELRHVESDRYHAPVDCGRRHAPFSNRSWSTRRSRISAPRPPSRLPAR
jgi:hypothetical protein